jgi:hypothetical protein
MQAGSILCDNRLSVFRGSRYHFIGILDRKAHLSICSSIQGSRFKHGKLVKSSNVSLRISWVDGIRDPGGLRNPSRRVRLDAAAGQTDCSESSTGSGPAFLSQELTLKENRERHLSPNLAERWVVGSAAGAAAFPG